MPQGGWAHWSHSAQVPGGMGRKRGSVQPAPETEEGKRRSLPAGDAVHGEAPALTIDERRAAAGRAMARAREILDTLQRQGVRMPLTNQRLENIAQWGEGLLQRAVDGRPTDEASRAIHQGLDEQKVSAEYVRHMRRREDASGKRVCRAGVWGISTRCDALIGTAMHLSAQQKDACCTARRGTHHVQGRPTDELSPGIQVGPDAQSASATYVQQVRNRKDADGIRLLPH